ncbi:nucleotide exchange factor GrpE [Methylomagnum ishizawai]|uniref:nucleotide exchange factor GrpE n=1 Tax=Methylomagnum ishizawai TaxID=1760988 RepID=UPI001C33B9AE|nr:nucleotide exchange factor GrpE [Methylomagnum ishizawai]BBL76098.1 protein GrpE [Methylomagnum ishizawai]
MSQDDVLPESAQITEDPAAEAAETLEPTPETEQPAATPTGPLAEATRKAEENWEKFVRAQAEMDNLRRRAEKDVQDARKFAIEKFARELLTVVDSLELGLQAATGDAPEVGKLREGMELTLKQLLAALEKANVRPIDPEGEKFNPELHQAMAMQPSATAAPNTVIKVFQKGYLLNERLLRPAMVVIAQAQPQAAPRIDEQA